MRTTQSAFHPMRGHMADGVQITMDNGDALTLRSLVGGWALYKGEQIVSKITPAAHEITEAVVKYGRLT